MSFGNLSSIPNTLLGGDVVGILARQAIRLSALKRSLTGPGVDAGSRGVVYAPPVVFVAAVPVSVRTQEAYSFQADVTQTSIESGTVLSDHVILQPVRVDLSFEVSNWDKSAPEYSLQLLNQMFVERTPIDLLTEHSLMENMVMTNLQAAHSVPMWGALLYRASFSQIRFLSLKAVPYTKEKVTPKETTGGPDNSASSLSPTDVGQQKPEQSAIMTILEKMKE